MKERVNTVPALAVVAGRAISHKGVQITAGYDYAVIQMIGTKGYSLDSVRIHVPNESLGHLIEALQNVKNYHDESRDSQIPS